MTSVMVPKRAKYNVVKNNKTPKGPMSVGDVRFSIIIKAASPIMLIPIMTWLFRLWSITLL